MPLFAVTKPQMQSAIGAHVMVDGRPYVNFAGSSYLGLASQPEILNTGISTLQQYGAGAPLLRGQALASPAHERVEVEAAEFFQTPAALYVASGYLFGLTVLPALKPRHGVIFFDELVHYSLREAIAAAGVRSYAYRHADPVDLDHLLKQHVQAGETPLVATDGMFGLFGEIAPLDALWRSVAAYEGRLLVDESHSFGVLGPSGRGALEHHSLRDVDAVIGGSLAKGFGTCGGIVPASAAQVSAFRSTPAGLGASAGSAASAAMCAASLSYVRRHPELLSRLRDNVSYLKSELLNLGLNIPQTIAPVAAFTLGSDEVMRALQQRLLDDGIFVYYVRYLGAQATGAIRCGIFADHAREDLDRLISALRRWL
jgi:8-amino-7-oxononanoate synthase